ncbi:LysR substrate-binding domain-containing protein [Pseudomonas sp. G2-4]|uniref:LysR substrate-binding domain-containing protein n=1 Tax=Pseudomonas sp. G2-4 TaxID=1506334 RepID=UPI0024BB3422|nr:LysR substrate-binding domain-containing protein [Pseudomonas sp. G2-4]WHS62431.1 LysR substrate-binding domain-containing protein [Pseudomonas sp. G2-4]
MKTNFPHLPPLNSLIFFEAAARYKNFTKTADELCITQSAVSKQISMLEESLGFELFRREGRSLLLTDAGKEFHSDVNGILQQLGDSVKRIRNWANNQSVTVTCTQSVSYYWLFPRIARFNIQYPDITINIYATNEISETSCHRFDLGILNSDGHWRTQLHTHHLFEEEIYPICRHDYPVKGLLTPEQLLEQKLVHLDPSTWPWPTWIDWFSNFGLKYEIPKNAQLFNQVTLAINAMQHGMGIGQGWVHMTESMLQNGEIRRISEYSHKPGFDDHLVYSKSKPLSQSGLIFRDWLLEDAERSKRAAT